LSAGPHADVAALWHRDPDALRYLAVGYIPWLAVLNLAWEIAHLPLYTIWYEGRLGEITFAVAHCTLGDVLFGVAAIGLALVAVRAPALARWHWPRIATLTALISASYTVLSEWINVVALRSWAYAPSIPTLALGEFDLGLSPVVQWLAIPPAALWLASRWQPSAV